MDANFWLERWREGRTGFHQDSVTPLLPRYWPSLSVAPGDLVLVPLCGKSKDMLWLAGQGHRVLGVELSPLAVRQFFSENHLQPKVHASALGEHYVAGDIEIICGDIFALDQATMAQCAGVYDRAALIALPRPMRPAYVEHVYARLPPPCRGLLITLDYPQDQMEGPPFSVGADEVQTLFSGQPKAHLLDRIETLSKEPHFKQRGLDRLDTLVYSLGN
ncbi:thiopurine S-methyltransferase [Eoetvoesiella caeni]|uniref:Thiopurine S-methyltransferase n=1 Tax=Eoetvoesiella caeni TaxID=645616 RepID=A0A366HJI8_9BURK|nr:thiopurine S-methyltransferase [Eoetvoesiella caeni]MCI2807463.1 thiopurine S-methyltransferase [Eoetvoesiella caeni]NYT53142.1 thiopurine S-methyltransferase [Eoetvoesiella caeni]RBP43119.1 thiopurine S-methyltransferase [Eoetvoesiella caeni]